MLTETFDNQSASKINPQLRANAPVVDACIITFSWIIEQYVVKRFACEQIGQLYAVNGNTPIWGFSHQGRRYAFFKTSVGAPACAGSIEDTLSEIRTGRYIVFGGSGCLNREIAHGRVMVPTEAYRDEGTSYHYAPPADYIPVRNAERVAAFMAAAGIPFVKGRTWTTDAFYRETENNFRKRRAEGCISVEMECAALQAVCDFRGLELYMFLTSGDLLDAPAWCTRHEEGELAGTQHDVRHFDIALALAGAVTA